MGNKKSKGCAYAIRVLYIVLGVCFDFAYIECFITEDLPIRDCIGTCLLPWCFYLWIIYCLYINRTYKLTETKNVKLTLLLLLWIVAIGIDMIMIPAFIATVTDVGEIIVVIIFLLFQLCFYFWFKKSYKKNQRIKFEAIAQRYIKASVEEPLQDNEKGNDATAISNKRDKVTISVDSAKDNEAMGKKSIVPKSNVGNNKVEINNSPNFGDVYISKAYFARLNKICDELQAFLSHLSWQKNFTCIITSQYKAAFNKDESPINILKERVLSDIMTCYKNSNYSSASKSIEYFGLVMLSKAIETTSRLKYDEISSLNDEKLSYIQESYDNAQEKFAIEGDEIIFGLSSMLLTYDKTLALQYYIYLYRYVEAIILADDVVTSDEKFILDVLTNKMQDIEPGFDLEDDLYITNDISYHLRLQFGDNLIDAALYLFREKSSTDYDLGEALRMNPREVADVISELKSLEIIERRGTLIVSIVENEYKLLKALKKSNFQERRSSYFQY